MAGASESAGRSGDILVEVCLECGKQYMFEGEAPPDDMQCEKCGGTVFRRFDAATRPDDVQEDFADSTERDTAPNDPGPDVTAGDILDLDNL